MTLAEIGVGHEAEIISYSFRIPSECKSKLLALGLTRKVIVKVINEALFGDPIEIEMRGYNLSLRKSEASFINVKML